MACQHLYPSEPFCRISRSRVQLHVRLCYCGQVTDGSGKVLVVAVGPNSEWGKIMAMVGEEEESQTPLQEKLEVVAGAIGKVGVCWVLGASCVRLFVPQSGGASRAQLKRSVHTACMLGSVEDYTCRSTRDG